MGERLSRVLSWLLASVPRLGPTAANDGLDLVEWFAHVASSVAPMAPGMTRAGRDTGQGDS